MLRFPVYKGTDDVAKRCQRKVYLDTFLKGSPSGARFALPFGACEIN